MSVVSYGSNPKACFTWNTANLNYVVISYSSIGNATVSSANLTSGTYTSPDLSLNSSYTFTMTPYNLLGITGTPKIFTVDTTAPTTYAAAVGGGATSTSSAVRLQWYGSYSYVAISQSVNGGAYVDLSSVVVSTPYTVNDVSGNTALSYKITPYYSGVAGTAASVITVNTNVQAPRDVSAVYVDSSGALISFTVPKNTYSSGAVYTVRRTDPSGNTADVSGTTSPLWIQNLSAGIVYTVVAKTTLDGSASLVSTSNAVSFTTTTNIAVIDNLSTAGKSSLNGVFAVKLIYSSYTGPLFTIRRSSDNVTANFYADYNGNLGTSYLATGTSLTTWLSSATGYISTWYDQSKGGSGSSGKNATQTQTTRQPYFNNTKKLVDFSNSTYFNLPDTTVPYNNSAYTVILKHGILPTGSRNGWLGCGGYLSASTCNAFRIGNDMPDNGYYNYWWADGGCNSATGYGYSAGNIATFTYDGIKNSIKFYLNNVLRTSTMVGTNGYTSGGTNATMGVTNSTEYLNGEMYYLYITNSVLSTTDMTILSI